MFTSSFLPTIGGLQFQVKWLAEELARQGEEVYLLTPKDAGKYIDKQQNNLPKNIDLNFDTSSVRVRRHLCNTLKLLKAINKIKPDIIHVHSTVPDGFYVILTKPLHGSPVIITSHGIDIVRFREIDYGYRLNPLIATATKYVLKFCDRHVVLSDPMISFALEAGSSKEKIVKIPNAAPPKREVSEEVLKEVKDEYDITSDEKFLLSLSGMRPIKGLEYLIKAMPEVLRENPNTRLIIACKGEKYEIYLKNLVKNLNLKNYVNFVGFIVDEDRKWALVNLIDVFCVPSLFESFSTLVLEAMVYGKAIVASNTVGVPIENGENGLLVPPKTSGALSKAINALLSDEGLRLKLGEEAKRSAEKFNLKSIAERYISLYKDVVIEAQRNK